MDSSSISTAPVRCRRLRDRSEGAPSHPPQAPAQRRFPAPASGLDPAEGRHRVGKPDDLHRQGGSHLCQARLRSGTLSGGRAIGPQCRLGHVPPSLIFSAKVSFFPQKTRFKLKKSSVSMDTELFMLQKVLLISARPCRRPLRSASSEPRPRPC